MNKLMRYLSLFFATIKSQRNESPEPWEKSSRLPPWLHTAMLFSLAETLMPLAGLVIGHAASLLISNVMHFVGPLLLIVSGKSHLLLELVCGAKC
jgi:hypothetical protein